jgi:hypothetical protein
VSQQEDAEHGTRNAAPAQSARRIVVGKAGPKRHPEEGHPGQGSDDIEDTYGPSEIDLEAGFQRNAEGPQAGGGAS